MMRWTAVSLTIVLAPCAARADIKRHSAIPDAYLGMWTTTDGACEDPARTAVVLSARGYVSSTANCTVDFVSETASARGAVYSARLQCSEPAAKAKAKSIRNIIIRADGADRISMGPSFNGLASYQRCSPTGATLKQ
jgi:hypothetical protein